MKDSLLALARSTHPSAQPWKKKLGAALDALGVEGASDAGTSRLAQVTEHVATSLDLLRRVVGVAVWLLSLHGVRLPDTSMQLK